MDLALLIWFQIWLSTRKSVVPGLSVIALTSILFIGLTVWSFYTAAGYHNVLLSRNLNNGHEGEITIRLDRKDKVVSMSALVIRDKTGEKLDEISWGGELYGKIQKEMTKGYDVDEHTPYLSLDNEIKNSVQIKGATFSRTFFLVGIIFIDLPLLAIHLTKRKQMSEKKRSEELKKMNIESL